MNDTTVRLVERLLAGERERTARRCAELALANFEYATLFAIREEFGFGPEATPAKETK